MSSAALTRALRRSSIPSRRRVTRSMSHRGAFVEAEHPTAGKFMQVGPVLAGMPKIGEPVVLPDPDATQTVEILEQAGVSKTDLAAMQKEGVLA